MIDFTTNNRRRNNFASLNRTSAPFDYIAAVPHLNVRDKCSIRVSQIGMVEFRPHFCSHTPLYHFVWHFNFNLNGLSFEEASPLFSASWDKFSPSTIIPNRVFFVGSFILTLLLLVDYSNYYCSSIWLYYFNVKPVDCITRYLLVNH